MALTETVLTGRFPFADDVVPASAVAKFVLSGVDVEGGDVVLPDERRVALTAGALPGGFTLWSNGAGGRGTHYEVTVEIIQPAYFGPLNTTTAIPVGFLVVPAVGGPYAVADLLVWTPPGPTAVDVLALAQAAALVATAQAGIATGAAAQAAADALATAADRVQTGLDRVQTGLDRVQTGVYRDQAAVLAAAAGAPIGGALPTLPDAGHAVGSYFRLLLGPGVKIYRNDSDVTWTDIHIWERGPRFDTVALLLADTSASYGGAGTSVSAGVWSYVEVPAGSAFGPTGYHVTNAGGALLQTVFVDGLDPRQIGALADGSGDDAPYVETAFLISNSVKLGTDCTWRLASVIGIPNGSLYETEAWNIIGFGGNVVLDGVAAGDAILTSASAKLDPESTANLYAGTLNIVGLNISQSSASVLINGDRLYNIMVTLCRIDGITSVAKSYRPKSGGFPNGYLQSLTLAHNHFSQIAKIVDAKRGYNFRWDHNYAEACGAGIYIDGPDDAAVVGFSMIGGHFEGGGQAVRLGKVLSGSVHDVYFEANSSGDTTTNKCDIQIGVGGGRSQAFDVSRCTFQPTVGQKADSDYVSIKDDATPVSFASIAVTLCTTGGTRLYQPSRVRMQFGNTVGNGSTDAIWNSRAPLPHQNAGVSFFSAGGWRTFTAINDAGALRVASVDVAEIVSRIGTSGFVAGSSGEIRVDMRFATVGGIQTGAAYAVIDFLCMPASAGVSSGVVADIYASFSLRSFVQIAAGQSIETTYGGTTKAHFGTPVLTVSRSGTLYTLRLTTFTAGASLPNYGPATQVYLAVTSQINGQRNSFDLAPNVFPTL